MFFPQKMSDWKYLRDSKNDSFIFFESIEPIQDINSFFSKEILHWSNKKKILFRKKPVVNIFFFGLDLNQNSEREVLKKRTIYMTTLYNA